MARERSSYNRISGVRNPSLIVIATEGEKTERHYFEGIKSKCAEHGSKIRLEILPARPLGQSSPSHVLQQLNQYKSQYGLNKYDELCMVIDRDEQSWTSAELSDIARVCTQKRYLLALSNPAFEIWLILHFKMLSDYSPTEQIRLLENKNKYLKNELKTILGRFNPSKLNIDDFWHNTQQAIERAETIDLEPQNRWPNNLATRVYLLVKKIIATTNL